MTFLPLHFSLCNFSMTPHNIISSPSYLRVCVNVGLISSWATQLWLYSGIYSCSIWIHQSCRRDEKHTWLCHPPLPRRAHLRQGVFPWSPHCCAVVFHEVCLRVCFTVKLHTICILRRSCHLSFWEEVMRFFFLQPQKLAGCSVSLHMWRI